MRSAVNFKKTLAGFPLRAVGMETVVNDEDQIEIRIKIKSGGNWAGNL